MESVRFDQAINYCQLLSICDVEFLVMMLSHVSLSVYVAVWASLTTGNSASSPNGFYPLPPKSQYSWPSPNATGMGWDIAFRKAVRFVNQLTVDEKVNICTGSGPP
jgi:hypothetical protein